MKSFPFYKFLTSRIYYDLKCRESLVKEMHTQIHISHRQMPIHNNFVEDACLIMNPTGLANPPFAF